MGDDTSLKRYKTNLVNSQANMSLLFLLRYGPYRDLHSFPTRRSSDLRSSTPCYPACMRTGPATSRSFEHSPAAGSWSAPSRSEEHTSELQSQSNIVCRLLLAKKKLSIPRRSINSTIP